MLGKLIALSLLLQPLAGHALPVVDQIVPSNGQPVKVYPDHNTPGVYWYIPVSVEPWSRDEQFKSSLYSNGKKLSFVFRGQASVDDDILKQVAKGLGTSVKNLTPIAYDYSRNLICEDVFMGSVQWAYPKMIGNYLEVVPVSLRTMDPDMVDELEYHIKNGGLACTVEVGFKAVYTAYDLYMTADYKTVYERFEAAAHAEYLWWEVDIHAMIESLIREGAITITTYEDRTTELTESDKRLRASMDQIIQQITTAMFTPALKLPQASLPDRGKPWSLRADYTKQTTKFHFEARLNSKYANIKDTQIGLRIAIQ